MGNLRTENKFISVIISEKLPIETILKANFDSTWLKYNVDIWEWILNYYQTNHNLPSRDLLETRYPAFIFDEDTKDTPYELLDALRQGSEGDRLNEDINQAVNLLLKNKDPRATINFLREKLDRYDNEIVQDVYDLSNDEDAAKLIEKYNERRRQLKEQGFVGIPTGFGIELDTWLNGGLQKGNLYGILAPLGVGKTWGANIIAASALEHGKTPFILALEGTLEKEGYRSLSTVAGLSNSQLHTATASDMEIDASITVLKNKARKFGGHYYLALHGNRQAYTPGTLNQKIMQYHPDIVIVDYLALMATVQNKGADDWAAVIDLSRSLKRLAVQHEIPIMATLQGNRASSMAEFLSATDSSNYGPLRDFDGVLGFTKSQSQPNILRVGDVKGRDTNGSFRAYYQTAWDTGKVRFMRYADEGDTEF